MTTIDLYGAEWCPDCRRAKAYLDEQGHAYNYIDISKDETAALKVQEINKGKRIIPTLLINEEVVVNPDNVQLEVAIRRAND